MLAITAVLHYDLEYLIFMFTTLSSPCTLLLLWSQLSNVFWFLPYLSLVGVRALGCNRKSDSWMETGSNLEILGNWRNQLKIEEEQKEAIQPVNSPMGVAVTAAELGNPQLTVTMPLVRMQGAFAGVLTVLPWLTLNPQILFFPCPFGSPSPYSKSSGGEFDCWNLEQVLSL